MKGTSWIPSRVTKIGTGLRPNGIDHYVGSAHCEPVGSALSHPSSNAEFIYIPRYNRLHVVNVLQGDAEAEVGTVQKYTGAISATTAKTVCPTQSQRKWLGGPVFSLTFALCNELCLNRQSLILQTLHPIGPANAHAVEQASPT